MDDLWELGKPVGVGGPWKDTTVEANVPSDPYLMTGYDQKTLALQSSEACRVTVEIDISGMGDWQPWNRFNLRAGAALEYTFPEDFQAYWIRFRSDTPATLSAQLEYR